MKFKQILAGTLAAAMVFTNVPMAGVRKLPAKAAEMEVVDDGADAAAEADGTEETTSESQELSAKTFNAGSGNAARTAETPVNLIPQADIVAWSGQTEFQNVLSWVSYLQDGVHGSSNAGNRWVASDSIKGVANPVEAVYVVFDLGKDLDISWSEIKVFHWYQAWACKYGIYTSDTCEYEDNGLNGNEKAQRLTHGTSTEGWDLVASVDKTRSDGISYPEDVIVSDANNNSLKRYVMFRFTEMRSGAAANAPAIQEIEIHGVKKLKNVIEPIDLATLVANARANSEQKPSNDNGAGNDGPATWAFDGNDDHWWHARYQGSKQEHEVSSGAVSSTNPIWIQTGFGTPKTDVAEAVDVKKDIRKVTYQARGSQGCFNAYELQIADMTETPDAVDADGYPADSAFRTVKSGNFRNTTDEQEILLAEPVAATHIRFKVTSVHANSYPAAKQIQVFEEISNPEEVLAALKRELGALIAEKEAFDPAIYTGVRGIEEELQAAKDTLANENATVDELRAQIDSLSAMSEERYVEDEHGTAVYLSDLNSSYGTTGWGGHPTQKDESIDHNPLKLFDGTTQREFAKGLGGHATCEMIYDISGKDYQIFTSYVGIDEEMASAQSTPKVRFDIYVSSTGDTYENADWGDAVWTSIEKHRSGCNCGCAEKNRTMEQAIVDVSGAKYIKLQATYTGANNGSCHVDWADARFYEQVTDYTATAGYTSDSAYKDGATASKSDTGYTQTVSFYAPEQTGYIFAGWYDSEDGTTKVSDENPYSQVLWGNTTLYAKYERIADKTELQKAFDEKRAIRDDADYNKTYNLDSRNTLEAALQAVEAVLNNSNATQAEVDAALEGLNVTLVPYNMKKHSDYWDYKMACENMADQTLEDAIWHYQIKGADSQWADLPSEAFNGTTWMQSGNNQHGTYYWSKLGRDEMTSTFGDQSIPESEWKKAVAFAWKAADPGYYRMKLSVGNGDNGNAGNGLVMSINHVKETEEATDGKVIDNFTASANTSATSKIAKMNANDWIRLAADSQDKWVSTFEMEILNATAQEYAVQYLEETNGVENGDYTKESKQAVVDARDALQAAAGADNPDMADIDAKITALETAIANLEEYVAVTGITLSETTANLKVGETLTLTATIEPTNATNQGITWTTSNASAATVKDGVVTARKAGTATITATGADGAVATCEVTVSNPEVTVTVVAPGYIDVNLDDSEHTDSVTVEYMSLVTVRTEDENEAGEEFVGWHDGTQYVSYSSSYTLFARKNITLTPQYKAKAPEEIPDVLSRIDGYYKEETANKTQHVYTLTASRVVPAAATKTGKIEEQGFLISTKEISKENLTLTVQEDGTVVKPAGVIRKAGNSKSLIGSYILDVRTKNSPIYVKSYVIYTDKQNVKRVVCSEMATVYAN